MQETEVWPGHLLAKNTEVGIISKHFAFSKEHMGLEVGCGDGLESALLSGLTRKMIASDLLSENSLTHTIGIDVANKNFVSRGCKNVQLASCSTEALSFRDNSFDFVFSSSTLEHLNNKKQALYEMRRVLKPQGSMIFVLPTHMPCLYAYVHTFLYPLARLLKVFTKERGCHSAVEAGKENTGAPLLKRFFLNHPSFPLPEMHGTYKNIFEEFNRQIPSNWVKLIEGCGLKITKSFSVCCIPWLILEPFSTRLAAKIYAQSRDFHIKHGSNAFIKSISYLIGFTAVKV